MALRQRVWVDRSVQGVLVGRVILYWFCALLYVGLGSACFQYNQNPEWTLAKHAQVLFGQVWPWLPTAFILLPLAIYDVVRLSNLFAGPVYRLRQHFASLRQDIACAPLVFREEDYWRDLAAPINDMQAEILRLRTGIIELQKAASKSADSTASSNRNATSQVEVPVEENYKESLDSTSAESIPSATQIDLSAEPIAPAEPIAKELASGDSATTEPEISEKAVREVIGSSAVINEVVSNDAAVAIAPLPAPVAGNSPIESINATPAS